IWRWPGGTVIGFRYCTPNPAAQGQTGDFRWARRTTMHGSRWCLGFAMLGLILAPVLVPGLAGVAHAGPAAAPVVLEGARLIDGTGGPPRDNAALVVEGDKITAVGVAGKLARPKGARVIDVHGRTIMPGLISAHSHAGLVKGAANSA